MQPGGSRYIYSTLYDALWLNDSDVKSCCNPPKNSSLDFHVISSPDHGGISSCYTFDKSGFSEFEEIKGELVGFSLILQSQLVFEPKFMKFNVIMIIIINLLLLLYYIMIMVILLLYYYDYDYDYYYFIMLYYIIL
jgi:hypothetical protein